jgi:hypothetical protein
LAGGHRRKAYGLRRRHDAPLKTLSLAIWCGRSLVCLTLLMLGLPLSTRLLDAAIKQAAVVGTNTVDYAPQLVVST